MNNNHASPKDPQELREYRRIKVAVCRANKVKTIKKLQDAINAHRAKLHLPLKTFPTTKISDSNTMKGKARPIYEPPPEMRKHMTNSEISAWKAMENKKRRNAKARVKKAQEDEFLRSLKKELKELERRVGELNDVPEDTIKPASGNLACTDRHVKVRDSQEKKHCGIQVLLQAAKGSFDAPKNKVKSATGMGYTKITPKDHHGKVITRKEKKIGVIKDPESEAAINVNCETPQEQHGKIKGVQEKNVCRIEDLEAAISFNRAKLKDLEQIVQELKDNSMTKKKDSDAKML